MLASVCSLNTSSMSLRTEKMEKWNTSRKCICHRLKNLNILSDLIVSQWKTNKPVTFLVWYEFSLCDWSSHNVKRERKPDKAKYKLDLY